MKDLNYPDAGLELVEGSANANNCQYNRILESALANANRGWRQFPLYGIQEDGTCSCGKTQCSSPGKHPITRNGCKDASNDPDQIRAWFTNEQNRNLAVATTNLVVIDLDGQEGIDAFQAILDEEEQSEPITPCSSTGRGRHLYFTVSEDQHIKNSAGKLGKHIDVRGSGGYVVVPPSCHANGKTYKWEAGRSPDEIALAPLPEWLLKRLMASEMTESGKRKVILDNVIQAGTRNTTLASIAGGLRRQGLTLEEIESRILEINRQSCKPPLPEPEVEAIAQSIGRYPAGTSLILDPRKPMDIARKIVADNYSCSGSNTILSYDGAYYVWRKTHYQEVSEDDVRSKIYLYTEKATLPLAGSQNPTPFDPDRTKVGKIEDALKAITFTEPKDSLPRWLTYNQYKVEDLLPCANGLLHVPTKQLIDHTPSLFNLNALDYDYDHNAPRPTRWLNFLAQIWPTEPDCISTLQEMMGYCLSPDTRQQKLFLILGPKRSGKGTIARILTAIIGKDNVCSPTLSGLSTNFGIQPMIGKQVATITDARLGGKSDQQVIVERLLSISGEDNITIDRKYKTAWTGKLNARFVILTNEMPRLSDASGALANRFIILKMTRSFLGREDTQLTEKLLEERAGILNWAIKGLDQLRARGRFLQPKSGQEILEELTELGSPVEAFVNDQCVIDLRHEIEIDALYLAWQQWCGSNGWNNAGTVQTFGRNLRAAYPEIQVTRPSGGKEARGRRLYRGIGLVANTPSVRSGPQDLPKYFIDSGHPDAWWDYDPRKEEERSLISALADRAVHEAIAMRRAEKRKKENQRAGDPWEVTQ